MSRARLREMSAYQKTIREKINSAVGTALFWLIGKGIEQEAKKFTKMSTLCHVSCFVAIWSQITEGKPIDRDSPLFDEITDVINFHLHEISNSRESISYFERRMRPLNYARW